MDNSQIQIEGDVNDAKSDFDRIATPEPSPEPSPEFLAELETMGPFLEQKGFKEVLGVWQDDLNHRGKAKIFINQPLELFVVVFFSEEGIRLFARDCKNKGEVQLALDEVAQNLYRIETMLAVFNKKAPSTNCSCPLCTALRMNYAPTRLDPLTELLTSLGTVRQRHQRISEMVNRSNMSGFMTDQDLVNILSSENRATTTGLGLLLQTMASSMAQDFVRDVPEGESTDVRAMLQEMFGLDVPIIIVK